MRAEIALALAGAVLLACSGDPDGGYDVAVRVSAQVPELEAVEVVLTADPCSSPVIASGLAPSTSVSTWRGTMDDSADEPALGIVGAGRYALSARGFSDACRVVAAGCSEARIDADGRGELEVLLGRIEGPGCALGQTCGVGGRCAGDALACGPEHIGPWRDAAALPSPRAFAGVGVHRDQVVVAGGGADRTSSSTDVLVASIGGGAGAGIGAWSMETPLPGAITAPAVASDGRHLFVVGGLSGGTPSASVYVSSDSSTLAWATETLPAPRVDHGVVVVLDALYVVGGRAEVGGDETAQVLRSTIAADGVLGSWADAAPLPEPSAILSAFVRHNRVYAVANERTYVAIANDAGLGPWARIEQPLPVGGEPTIALAEDAVLVVGGARSDGTLLTDVFAAALDDAGAIRPWRRVSALPTVRIGSRAISSGESIAVIGGADEEGTALPSLLARHCEP